MIGHGIEHFLLPVYNGGKILFHQENACVPKYAGVLPYTAK